jgi:hypothetical protein
MVLFISVKDCAKDRNGYYALLEICRLSFLGSQRNFGQSPVQSRARARCRLQFIIKSDP